MNKEAHTRSVALERRPKGAGASSSVAAREPPTHKDDVVGIVFYAGHGMEYGGENLLARQKTMVSQQTHSRPYQAMIATANAGAVRL